MRDPLEPLPEGLREGDVIGGKLRLGEVLGAGGMGIVVAAHHLDLDVAVALKFLHRAIAADEAAVARLLREARAAARLSGPHATRIHDVARLPDGTPYIVMERLVGIDLASMLRSRGPLPVAEAVRWTIEACEALEEAHRHGIVHRDVKPANLFVARVDGGATTLKLLDFGISRLSETIAVELTRGGDFIGTPFYTAPEQLVDPRSVDARADLYSLGACLFAMLTGRAPFVDENVEALARKVLRDAPPSLRASRPDAPAALERVIDQALTKDPDARIASAGAMREALAACLPGSATVSAGAEHLGDDTIVALQEGAVDRGRRRAIEDHLSTCDDCRALVAAARPVSATVALDVASRNARPTAPLEARSAPAAATTRGRASAVATVVALSALLAALAIAVVSARHVEGAATASQPAQETTRVVTAVVSAPVATTATTTTTTTTTTGSAGDGNARAPAASAGRAAAGRKPLRPNPPASGAASRSSSEGAPGAIPDER